MREPRIIPTPERSGRPVPPGRRGLRTATAFSALLASLAAVALPAHSAHAVDTSLTVDFAAAGGAPGYGASGTTYGMTPNGTSPQDHFYQDIKWKFMRAGGAQLNSGGYGTSLTHYQTRWNSTLAQYNRTKSLGATFVILPHDLWGADSTTSQGWPGDNGDWTLFDSFLDQLIGDVKANNMTVQWDIWNEPDNGPFWGRSQAQYLAMWKRSYQKIRAAIPNAVIVGPSTYRSPAGAASGWWDAFLDCVKANNVEPNVYSWHDLPGDLVADSNATSRRICSPRPVLSTCRWASGSSTATTAPRPATSSTSSPAPTPTAWPRRTTRPGTPRSCWAATATPATSPSVSIASTPPTRSKTAGSARSCSASPTTTAVP